MSNFTNEVREMVTFLRGAIAARPNDPDGKEVGNIANLFELCVDKLAVAQKKADDLEKFIEGKNGYKERIEQLYEENLRLGNEQIDLADKVREECAQVCDVYADDPVYCGSAIRAMKERP